MLPKAIRRLQQIFDYHHDVVGIRTARKMQTKIEDTIARLIVFPNMGIIEPELTGKPYLFRSIVAHHNFKVIYYVKDEVIYIFTIWDCRQNPEKMKED